MAISIAGFRELLNAIRFVRDELKIGSELRESGVPGGNGFPIARGWR